MASHSEEREYNFDLSDFRNSLLHPVEASLENYPLRIALALLAVAERLERQNELIEIGQARAKERTAEIRERDEHLFQLIDALAVRFNLFEDGD